MKKTLDKLSHHMV